MYFYKETKYRAPPIVLYQESQSRLVYLVIILSYDNNEIKPEK
jgi:hypothetical protein